ncbi:MAG: hypothetical protein BWY71_02153 [Planctomycetes bacterium ADurb.Bin412]|nr:MAG: hypothetical protein BWY71_02153 [Planctomycetes bacterium ADurb.Bin412]
MAHLYLRDIGNIDGNAVARSQNDALNILGSFEHSQSPDVGLLPAFYNETGRGIGVVIFDGFNNLAERQVVFQQGFGPDQDMILFDKSAEAVHLIYPGYGFKLRTYHVVLDGPQLHG